MSLFAEHPITEYQSYLKTSKLSGGWKFMEAVKTCKEIIDVVLSRLPENMHQYAKENIFYTGTSLYQISYHFYNQRSDHHSTINDFDFYFRTEEARDKILAEIKKYPFKGSKFAITTRPVKNGKTLKLQFIHAFVGSPEEITGCFDFAHCMLWYDPVKEVINVPKLLVDAYSYSLVVNPNLRSPMTALPRLKKFLQRGFTINDKELLKLALIINQVDMADPKKFAEQSKDLYANFEEAVRIHKEIHRERFNNDFMEQLK